MKKLVLTWILTGAIVLFISLIFLTNLGHYNYVMNSDIGAEAILGKVIWESGQNVPDNWYSSTEARVVTTPNVAALFYGICHSKNLAMGLACCTMTLLIVVTGYYFGKMIRLSLNSILLLVLLILSIPNNFEILQILYLFACYYSVHVIALFITLGTYSGFLRTGENKEGMLWIGMGICMIVVFLLGLQGMRGILILYGPLLGLEIIRRLYLLYCRKKQAKLDNMITIWVGCLLLHNFIGTRFPFSVGQNFSRNIRKGFSKLHAVVLPDMGRAIGFENTHMVGKVCLFILLLGVVYVFAEIIWKMIMRKELKVKEWSFLLLCISPVLTALIVAFTTVESSARYYFVILFAMGLSAVLFVEELSGRKMWLKVLTGVGIALLVIMNMKDIYGSIIQGEEPTHAEAYQTVCFLEENGYDMAYTTFEHANMLTVLSDGKVKVAAVASVEKMDVCKWLSCKDWYVPNVPCEMRTAYVITDANMEKFQEFLLQHKEEVFFLTEIGNYHIYVSNYNFSTLS